MMPARRASALVFALTWCVTAAADGASIEQIGCDPAAAGLRSSVQDVAFESRDRVGNGRTIRATVTWKRFDNGLSRVLVRVHEPRDLDGAGVLLIEKESRSDMFVYLPDLKKVKRVTSRMLGGSLFGSDFTYEDFMQLQGMGLEGHTEVIGDQKIGDVAVRVVSHVPAPEAGSSYERVTTHWDTELCLPLKMEMWERGDRLRKVMEVDRSQVDRSHAAAIPRRLTMRDLRDETSTELSVESLEVDVEVPRKMFSTAGLERSR